MDWLDACAVCGDIKPGCLCEKRAEESKGSRTPDGKVERVARNGRRYKTKPMGTPIPCGPGGKGERVSKGPETFDRKRAKGLSCEIAGCGRARKARGLCNSHYLKFLKTGVRGGTLTARSDKRRVRLDYLRVRPETMPTLRKYAEGRGMRLCDFAASLLDAWAQERGAT